MAWTQGTSILSVAEFGDIVAARNLSDFDKVGDTALRDVLIRASDAIYAHIRSRRNGVDPARITNLYAFKPAVAAHAHATLVISGALSPPEGQVAPDRAWDWSERELEHVTIETAEQPKPKRVVRPRARNVNRGFF